MASNKPPIIGQDELTEHKVKIDWSTVEDKDELLTDFLVRSYPTLVTQDN